MTTEHLLILTGALVSLAGSGLSLWLIRKHIEDSLVTLAEVLHEKFTKVENSLRSHVIDEADTLAEGIHKHASNGYLDLKNVEAAIITFLRTHADDLKKNAEAIKAHSIETHDRAVSRDIAPRSAVSRN